jgi:Mrp family chromosome partitioning ATPase/capsular polysaccharide biosynthesis protein
VVARWKWLVIAVTVLVAVVGAAYTWTQTPMYSATTRLLYVKQIDIANPLSQSYIDVTAQTAEIESVPAVIAGSEVRAAAEDLMKPASVEAGYSVSVALQPGINNNYSNVVDFSAVSPDSEAAADAANSYAEAFITWGRDSARAQVADAIDVVKGQLSVLVKAGGKGSAEYVSLQQSLQSLELLRASSKGNFKVITEAYPPGEPFAPDKTRGIILALVAGLVLGVGSAFIVEQFDTRVRGTDQIVELLELPVIGHVPPVGRRGRDGVVLPTLVDPYGPEAEAYRLLRSNLDFTAVDDDIKSLLITSSLQGEGKSVTACNLAVSMALAGRRVVLVDADLRGPRVHAYLGVPNTLGLSSVIARRATVGEALVSIALDSSTQESGALVMTAHAASGEALGTKSLIGAGVVRRTRPPSGTGIAEWLWPEGPGEKAVLQVLTSGPLPPNPGEIVASRRLTEVVSELATNADIVLIDAPAMLPVGDTAALAGWVDALVYVVNLQKVRRPALAQSRIQLARLLCRKLGVIEVVDIKAGGYYGYRS